MFNFNIFGSNEGNIDVEKFDELIKQNYTVIDVRTPEEYNQSRIDGALLINFYDPKFKKRVNELDKDGKYLIYCRSGNRSRNALSMFKEAGILTAFHLTGGIISWHKAGKLIVN